MIAIRLRKSPSGGKFGAARGMAREAAPPSRWEWVWVFLLLPLLSAKGQDALYNALSLEEAVKSQTNALAFQPDQPHWGPVRLALGAYAGVSYDDNINESQTQPQVDVISQAGVSLNFIWPATDHSDLQIGTSIGYINYQKYTANNGLEVSPDSALTYSFSWDDVTFTLYNQLSYIRQVTAVAALANVAILPQFADTVGAKAEWDPGHWTFQASYGHDINVSDHAHDYLNRASEDFWGRAGWRFSRATQAGLEISSSLATYQLAVEGRADSYSVGGYAEWQLRPSLHLTLRGGPTLYQFYTPNQGGGNSTLNAYYVSFDARQQLAEFLSHSLHVDRNVQAGTYQGSSYIEQLSAAYSVSWALTRRITLDASLTYENGRQPFVLFPTPVEFFEDYQRYGISVRGTWRFSDHLATSLGFSHWLRHSNLPDRDYTENSVFLNLNYTF